MYEIPPAPFICLTLEALGEYTNRLPRTMAVAVDEQGTMIHCNSQFLKETGYAASAVFQRKLNTIMDIEFLNLQPDTNIPGIFNQRMTIPATVHLKKADGTAAFVHVIQLFAETDQGALYLLLLYDQEPIQEGNLITRFGETMLADDHIGVILLHPENMRILEISPLACQLLGVTKSDVVNEPLSGFFASAPSEFALIRNALEGGPPVRNHPLTWLQQDKLTELLMDVGLFRNPLGRMEGAYILFKDVTNLRSLEVQLQRSDRLAMIGQVAAGAAHEIRNPLTAIRGFLQMFRKTLTESGMHKEVEYTNIMLTELDRINDLVSEFLMLSKPRHVVNERIDMEAVLREIMPMISSEALLHGVSVHLDAEGQWPRVMADREMLKQVFLNICKNGIEAMTNGGTLTVSGRMEVDAGAKRLVIDIQDTGPGIPVHMLDNIFDPFVTTKQNGTGLGLSVCQRILHDFGGFVRAASNEKGALFTIVLPF
ncbi:PAS domain-containing protein [Paenibacillus sp. sptzw28]|uniref:ATP-binding protein n=1 Tax=Paenibacillus sp. sptzw28 TaxID=715179 RepID=UPI001C6F59D4|nr:ATP-binding protein [Paenibacillus sp. sptzw28]QYR21567.1 PAS domain-containing protein [Paenibacillus sp. sptzw28]